MSSKRSKPRIIAQPAVIVAPLLPQIDPTNNSDARPSDLATRTFSTGPQTLEGAIAGSESVLERLHKRFEAGDKRAIARLLDVNPRFVSVPWVCAAIKRDPRLLRTVGESGGRPVGMTEDEFVRRSWFVAQVDALVAGTKLSREEIFKQLASGPWGMGYERVREVYYETMRDERFGALFFRS